MSASVNDVQMIADAAQELLRALRSSIPRMTSSLAIAGLIFNSRASTDAASSLQVRRSQRKGIGMFSMSHRKTQGAEVQTGACVYDELQLDNGTVSICAVNEP